MVVPFPVERNVWWQVMEVVRRYAEPANVMLVTERWSDEQIAGLWHVADCYVSLTCSEGWGLGAFDAAVAGVPVVITGHGGHLEWIGADHPGLLPFTIAPADHPDRTMFDPGMEWAIADVDAARSAFREIYERGGPVAAAAPMLADRLRVDYRTRPWDRGCGSSWHERVRRRQPAPPATAPRGGAGAQERARSTSGPAVADRYRRGLAPPQRHARHAALPRRADGPRGDEDA